MQRMNAKQWILFIALLISTGCTLFLYIWRTSDKGVAVTQQHIASLDKETELQIARERTKQIRAVAASGTRVPASMIYGPVSTSESFDPATAPSNCKTVGANEGATRSTAIRLAFGQCIIFQAHDTKKSFYAVLGSAPRLIAGSDTSFGHLREETPEDKASRRARCMEKTNDAGYCDAEMRKSYGVRVDDCVTKDSPDKCLGYLTGKTSIPIAVQTYGSVTISMK